MAENWVNVANIDTRYGITYLQYDSNSTGQNRSCRVYFQLTGVSIDVIFKDFTVNGTRIGDINVTGSGVLWSGSLSGSFSVSYWCSWFDIGVQYYSGSGNVPAGGTAPSGLAISLVDCGSDWANISVSISSWGSPSTSTNRYLEAAVLGSTTYGAPRRFQKAYRETSADITVSNSSETDSTPLTIRGNTQYRIGGYASNTVLSTYTVGSTFITKPASPSISASDQGHGQIDFVVSHDAEGSADTVIEEYSIDGGTTWTTITGGAFSLTLSSQTVVTVRRGNTTGYMSETVTVTPTFTTAIYASVMNKAKIIDKIYAPVNGKTKKIAKIYASVNGKTKLIFEDPS